MDGKNNVAQQKDPADQGKKFQACQSIQRASKEKKYYAINSSKVRELGFTNEDNTEYIVNYLTGEVINKTIATTSEGEVLYTYARTFEIE